MGSLVVPEHLKGPLILDIIEKSLLGRLGVQNVAVQTDTTKYAEIDALPTANVIAEGAELTETDPSFTERTLQMFSYRAGTIVSQEFLEDSIQSPKSILEPIAQAIAEDISNDFILGGGANEPMGLSQMTGMYTRYHMGVNGAVLSHFAPQEHLWRKLRERNQDVSAFVMAPRTLGAIKLLTTGTELVQLPNIFPEIPNVDTNAVSITETQGSSCRNLFFHLCRRL